MKDQQAGKSVEIWFQDEARIGQQGTLTHVWAETGSRPAAVKQSEYEWLYVFAAVNPVSGESSAILTPTVNTHYMNEHLRFISQQAGADRHVVCVLDQAGWHVAKALKVPSNITLLHLPAYSPELNPIERVWAYLRSHYLSNRAFKDYDDIFDSVRHAWLQIDQTRLRSITHTQWITPAA